MRDPQNSWQLRAPWDDETDRLNRHFRSTVAPPGQRDRWIHLAVASAPERIVGLARLQPLPPDPARPSITPPTRLAWDMRPAWQNEPATSALLNHALVQARALGLKQLFTMLPVDHGLMPVALDAGFTEQSRQEVWSVEIAHIAPQLEGRASDFLGDSTLSVAPLAEESLPTVRRLCAATQLLSAERVVSIRADRPEGYDPTLSFVVGDPAHPSAFLLGREHLGKGYLEVLARDPASTLMSFDPVLALLRAFVRGVAQRGLTELSCAVQPNSLRGLVPLLRRFGARRLEGVATLHLDL